jgi:hypothetical protein
VLGRAPELSSLKIPLSRLLLSMLTPHLVAVGWSSSNGYPRRM